MFDWRYHCTEITAFPSIQYKFFDGIHVTAQKKECSTLLKLALAGHGLASLTNACFISKILDDEATDELSLYFKREVTPKVVITSSDRPKNVCILIPLYSHSSI